MVEFSNERVRARRIAALTSLSLRTVQNFAASGIIPGACRLGKVWTFDEQQVLNWIKEKETRACEKVREDYIKEVKAGMGELKSKVKNTELAYLHLIGKKQNQNLNAGLKL